MILDWMTKGIRWSPGFLCLSHWKMITLNSLEILMRYVFLEDLRNNSENTGLIILLSILSMLIPFFIISPK